MCVCVNRCGTRGVYMCVYTDDGEEIDSHQRTTRNTDFQFDLTTSSVAVMWRGTLEHPGST